MDSPKGCVAVLDFLRFIFNIIIGSFPSRMCWSSSRLGTMDFCAVRFTKFGNRNFS